MSKTYKCLFYMVSVSKRINSEDFYSNKTRAKRKLFLGNEQIIGRYRY